MLSALAVAAAACAIAAHDEVHHIGSLHTEAHVPRHDPALGNAPRHFAVTYGHPKDGNGPIGVADLTRALGHAADPHVVPVRSYIMWAELEDIYSTAEVRGWEVRTVRRLCHRHKHHSQRHSHDELTGSLQVIASEDRREHWKEALAANRIYTTGMVKLSAGKYILTLSAKDVVFAAAEMLALKDEVRWVEPGVHGDALNDIATRIVQSDHGTHAMWDQPTPLDGTGELLLVGDTGVDVESCFFKDDHARISYYPQVNMSHRKIVSYKAHVNSATGQEDTKDAAGHGTHVVGSLIGSPVSGEHPNMERYQGLARGAKVFFTDLQGRGMGFTKLSVPNDLREYFNFSYALGARISHNSWGVGHTKTNARVTSMDREVDEYVWHHLDYFVVAGAGNKASSPGLMSPGTAKNAVSVGAHANELDESRRTYYPYYAHGPTFDGRIKPDILAPGGRSRLHTAGLGQCHQSSELSGTSGSARFVSGSAAMVRQYLREGWYPQGAPGGPPLTPSAALLRAMLMHSGRPVPGTGALPNNNAGWGRLALHDVLYFSGSNRTLQQFEQTHLHLVSGKFLAQDMVYQVEFDVQAPHNASNAGGVRVTLAFTDYPAALGATHSMINDLDLVVMLPNGTLLLGNGATHDRLNPVEQVRIEGAAAGRYRALVYGFHTPEYDPYEGVPFALVATGPSIVAHAVQAPARCPNDCTGRGTCDAATGLCVCMEGYHHADCSLCSSEIYCGGRGACHVPWSAGDTGVPTPTCECSVFFSGERCEKCSPNRYGPQCDHTCQCRHGSCDTSLPAEQRVCRCTGNWEGKDCQYCKHGFAGDSCTEPAHWCGTQGAVTTVHGERSGLVMVNSRHHYDNSQHCDWALLTPGAGWGVHLEFLEFDIEKRYDWLYIYEGTAAVPGRHKRRFDGISARHVGMQIEGPAYLRFETDYMGEGSGFLIRYNLTGTCTEATCGPNGRCAPPTSRYICECVEGLSPSSLCGAPTPRPTAVPDLATFYPTTPSPRTELPVWVRGTSEPSEETAQPNTTAAPKVSKAPASCSPAEFSVARRYTGHVEVDVWVVGSSKHCRMHYRVERNGRPYAAHEIVAMDVDRDAYIHTVLLQGEGNYTVTADVSTRYHHEPQGIYKRSFLVVPPMPLVADILPKDGANVTTFLLDLAWLLSVNPNRVVLDSVMMNGTHQTAIFHFTEPRFGDGQNAEYLSWLALGLTSSQLSSIGIAGIWKRIDDAGRNDTAAPNTHHVVPPGLQVLPSHQGQGQPSEGSDSLSPAVIAVIVSASIVVLAGWSVAILGVVACVCRTPSSASQSECDLAKGVTPVVKEVHTDVQMGQI